MNKRLHEPMEQVLNLLALKEYEQLARLTNGVRLSAGEIALAVADYGRTLIVPPSHAYKLYDVIQVRGAAPPRWSITMPLWTKEEGRSDLSVELTLTDHGDYFGIELNDLHVL